MLNHTKAPSQTPPRSQGHQHHAAQSKEHVSNPLFRRAADGLTAYQRHKNMMTDYLKYYAARGQSTAGLPVSGSGDLDALKSKHRFLRSDADDAALPSSWASRVAKKYYDRLFKEYCVADLSRYKTSQLALRWRTRREVVAGKGQFSCGNIACESSGSDAGLRSWEVNFAYVEDEVRKNALVKVRLCEPCSYKLNYRKIKEARKEQRKKRKRQENEENEEEEEEEEEEEDAEERHEAGAREGKRRRVSDNPKLKEEPDDSSGPHMQASNISSSDSGDELSPRHQLRRSEAYTAAEISSIWSAARPQRAAEEASTQRDAVDSFFADLLQ
ncbi:hypothetical protein HDU86_007004 [Geranomyces michiganensis]|nr:hypothetical protein HDU86_007004 [Geranomyces michiganensis]